MTKRHNVLNSRNQSKEGRVLTATVKVSASSVFSMSNISRNEIDLVSEK
jgi:hypothetical protein